MIHLRQRSICVLLAAAMAAGGCQVIPWVTAAMAPPEKIEAKYGLPENTTLLVLVRDTALQDDGETVAIRQQLTAQLSDQLRQHDVVQHIVSYDQLLTLMISDPDFDTYSADEVGRKLGANQVLLVKLTEFGLKDSELDPFWHGRLKTNIQVLDTSGQVLWPDDRPFGYPTEPAEHKTESEISPAYGEKMTEYLAMMMADHIAKLFYDHEIDAALSAQKKREAQLAANGLSME